MNRRGFLAMIGAVAVAPSLPVKSDTYMGIARGKFPGGYMATKSMAILELDGQSMFTAYDIDGRLKQSVFFYIGHYVNGARVGVEPREYSFNIGGPFSLVSPERHTGPLLPRDLWGLPHRPMNEGNPGLTRSWYA